MPPASGQSSLYAGMGNLKEQDFSIPLMRCSLPVCFVKCASKGQTSSALWGLVVFLELMCWKSSVLCRRASRQPGRRAALGRAERHYQRTPSPTSLSVLCEQRFYWGWGDLQLRSTPHSTVSTEVLHAVVVSSQYPLRLQLPFFWSALQRR